MPCCCSSNKTAAAIGIALGVAILGVVGYRIGVQGKEFDGAMIAALIAGIVPAFALLTTGNASSKKACTTDAKDAQSPKKPAMGPDSVSTDGN